MPVESNAPITPDMSASLKYCIALLPGLVCQFPVVLSHSPVLLSCLPTFGQIVQFSINEVMK